MNTANVPKQAYGRLRSDEHLFTTGATRKNMQDHETLGDNHRPVFPARVGGSVRLYSWIILLGMQQLVWVKDGRSAGYLAGRSDFRYRFGGMPGHIVSTPLVGKDENAGLSLFG